jgi:hypothetical protein
MRIDVESYGAARRDFYDLRSDLIEQDKKFDETSLHLLPYHQLHLAAMGNAGDAVCPIVLVQQEKASRRERFLAMDEAEFKACERYLRADEMWGELSDPQKLWAKLNCLYNHLDDPQQRMGEALLFLRKCATASYLPTDVCQHYMQKVRGLMATYPGKVADTFFRAQIEDIRDNIRNFLPDNERGICDKGQIADFQCTSDCFRIFIP